jgi:ligand-binding SRPBCC domain-containing protein
VACGRLWETRVLCGFSKELWARSVRPQLRQTGDYADVTVTSPFGAIPWPRLSRFNDEEMKQLMIDVVDRARTNSSTDCSMNTLVVSSSVG